MKHSGSDGITHFTHKEVSKSYRRSFTWNEFLKGTVAKTACLFIMNIVSFLARTFPYLNKTYICFMQKHTQYLPELKESLVWFTMNLSGATQKSLVT